MYRAVCLAALLASGLPGQEPPLTAVQALIDAGKLAESEIAVRRYIESYPASRDAQNFLGYILFREGNAKSSLAAYQAEARWGSLSAFDLLVVGCDHLLLEDYSAAGKWFAKAIDKDGGNALAFYYLGRAKYNEQHFEEAVGAFKECLRLDPKNVRAEDNLGLSLEALGKTEEALTAYRAAVVLDEAADRRDPGLYLNLGSLLLAQKQAAEAVPYLLQAVQMADGDARSHQELAKAFLALNRLDKAQAEAEKAVAIAPQNATSHYLLIQIYRKRGFIENANAESEIYTALTGAHSSPETPLAGARSLLTLGKLSEAEQATRDFLRTRNNSADGHYLLAYILFKEQRAKESLAEYTEAARYRIPTAAELIAVASDYVLLKDYQDADRWFTRAVELNPKDALGWYYLGRTKYNLNRFEEAIGAFRETLKLDPKNVKASDNLGLSYEGLNQTDEAVNAYRNAIEWQMGSPLKDSGPFLDLGSLLVARGQALEALVNLLQAAQISPRDYRVRRQLGKAYIQLNELDKARTELETAAELAPQNAAVHFMLGQIYRKQGLPEKAKSENERYSALVKSGSDSEN